MNISKLLFAGAVMIATTASMAQTSMQLTSASIIDGNILKPHACGGHGGQDVSVQLSVKNIPQDAKYISIVVDDPDAMAVAGQVWVHWNLFNIPANGEMTIPAGSPPAGEAGRSSGSSLAYEGMCPPNGTHTYRFAVFATKGKVKSGGFFGPTPMNINYFESKFETDIVSKSVVAGKF